MNPISALIALVIYCAVLGAADAIPPRSDAIQRRAVEVCPGALYFIRADAPRPTWAKHMRVACRIGDHVFLTDQPRKK